MLLSVVKSRISITSKNRNITHFRSLYNIYRAVHKHQCFSTSAGINGKMGEINPAEIQDYSRKLAPPLDAGKHKGQAGKIGVIGGSLEYNGAPYFAAITALKVGADIVHVFCPTEAASVIKSYSPELIVHPIFDSEAGLEELKTWLPNMHAMVIGPGLGRNPETFKILDKVILACKELKKPLVIDADALFYLTQRPKEILADYNTPVILTPNVNEYQRLLDLSFIKSDPKNFFSVWGDSITILIKGREDQILTNSHTALVAGGGSGRRCGGQGDLLAGSIAVFLNWSLQNNELKHDKNLCSLLACYAGCKLTRLCNAKGFVKFGRSMTTSDMLVEIHPAFEELFEKKN